jgi:hypothetical protein
MRIAKSGGKMSSCRAKLAAAEMDIRWRSRLAVGFVVMGSGMLCGLGCAFQLSGAKRPRIRILFAGAFRVLLELRFQFGDFLIHAGTLPIRRLARSPAYNGPDGFKG